jgi:hypothetical protein
MSTQKNWHGRTRAHRSAVHSVSTPPAAGRPQRRKPCQARWACRPGQPSVPAATPFAFRNKTLVVANDFGGNMGTPIRFGAIGEAPRLKPLWLPETGTFLNVDLSRFSVYFPLSVDSTDSDRAA